MPITTGVYITGSDTKIRQHKLIIWNPAEDITAHELAKLTPLLISMARDPMMYWEDFIPQEALRHFEIKDQ